MDRTQFCQLISGKATLDASHTLFNALQQLKQARPDTMEYAHQMLWRTLDEMGGQAMVARYNSMAATVRDAVYEWLGPVQVIHARANERTVNASLFVDGVVNLLTTYAQAMQRKAVRQLLKALLCLHESRSVAAALVLALMRPLGSDSNVGAFMHTADTADDHHSGYGSSNDGDSDEAGLTGLDIEGSLQDAADGELIGLRLPGALNRFKVLRTLGKYKVRAMRTEMMRFLAEQHRQNRTAQARLSPEEIGSRFGEGIAGAVYQYRTQFVNEKDQWNTFVSMLTSYYKPSAAKKQLKARRWAPNTSDELEHQQLMAIKQYMPSTNYQLLLSNLWNMYKHYQSASDKLRVSGPGEKIRPEDDVRRDIARLYASTAREYSKYSNNAAETVQHLFDDMLSNLFIQ